MTTLTIKVPEKAENKLLAIVKELGGEIVSASPDKQSLKKNKLVNEIRQGLKEVKEIREGKAKSYSMGGILNGEDIALLPEPLVLHI